MTDEARTRRIGREIFEAVRADRDALRAADRWTAALMDWSLQHDEARLQLFRFVDVLPALARDEDIVRHLREYFAGRPVPFARLLQLALGVARVPWLGERLIATGLRQAVRRLARRFIAGSTLDEAVGAAVAARRAGHAFTLDVLGEACVSDEEARAYERLYRDLVERLGVEARSWPAEPRIDAAPWGALPRVNVSVKLSALSPYLDPLDARSAEAAKARLRSILEAAALAGAHIHVDMEERRLEDLTLQVFTELCDEPAFRRTRNVGIVLQAYLREADEDVERLIRWARQRGTPVTVRLVKGAYWDFETAHAHLEGWPAPVWEVKRETDACFERLTRTLLEHADVLDLAVGSHNIRSIAHALAVREELGLPPRQVEFQMLYGMAAPLARALSARGERVRIYMPFGELIPGMAYLVRRLLENTSNESFLRRGFAERESPEVLLTDPAAPAPAPLAARGGRRAGADAHEASSSIADVGGSGSRAGVHGDPGPFRNEPHTDFALARERDRFSAALATVRAQFGRDYPLVIGGERVETAEWLISANPSRPAEIVGRAASASVADVDRAVQAAERALPVWWGLGAAERSHRLGRAAEILRARRAELAAWIVYEAAKPWREADGDVAEAIDFIEYYRRQATGLVEPQRLGDLPGEINYYLREPRGVVGVIAPWNFPLAILTGMTSAALATGNTVVMKPSEQTPVVGARLLEVLEEAGLPPGVVNYVPGRGEVAGDRIVRHPAVPLIAFTGSREVGTQIYATAAQPVPGARHLKRVVAEMGGKNAVIVDDDADLDEAVQGIIASAFGYAGQKCSACSRVIVVGAVYERLIERLVEAARTIPMGPADDPGTIIGPVIDEASRDRILGFVELGKRLARPALLRDLPPELEGLRGYYVAPAVFADVPLTSPLAVEEIFGSVLAVMPAASFEAALAIAMDVEYALTGGVFSRSPVHLQKARDIFRVGDLYLNRAVTGARVGRQPFGGRQLSGIGYQGGGPDYLLQFVEGRTITENTLRRGFASDTLA